MDRPAGLPRWVVLFVAAAALAAIAMIPRGVVRTTVAIDEFGPVFVSLAGTTEDSPDIDERQRVDHELPGVRAVVSREERDDGIVQTLLVGLAGPTAVAVRAAEAPDEPADREAPSPSTVVPASTAGSRAPPASY